MKNTYKKDYKKSYYFVDDYNMVLTQNYEWDTNGINGKGDSIARTARGFFSWGDRNFIDAIKSCWEKKETKKGYIYKGWRYPSKYEDTLSRDHTIWTVIALKLANEPKDKLKDFVKHIPWRLSKRYTQTVDTWLWFRGVAGIKWAKVLWILLQLIIAPITVLWHKFAYKMGGFKEEVSQDEFKKVLNDEKPKNKVYWVKKLYPVYALHQKSWELRLIGDGPIIKLLRRIYLSATGKTNYVIRILLGDDKNVSEKDVIEYKSMVGERWSTSLEPYINDRDLRINDNKEQIKYNQLDVDYLKKLYYSL